MATHVTACGVHVITMKRHIRFHSVRGKATCYTTKRSMKWFYHSQGTASAAETFEMPFIIVHLDLIRLHKTGRRKLHMTLVVKGGETEYY